MSEHFDAIIIGGGLAGLVCGAKLSHEGMKVLLLEQHSLPGGCATTFRHKEFSIEVGLHEMDGFEGANLKNKIFRELGVFNHLEFPAVPEFYRFVHGTTDIVVPHDIKQAQIRLASHFPDQFQGIATFYDRLINYRKYRSNENHQPTSLGAFLDSIFTNDEIKLALCGNLMAFSDDPYNISLDYFAQAQGTFHLSSGVFIKKGSQQLSDYFMNYITDHGGTVRLKNRVSRIITSNHRATGVEYHPVSNPASVMRAEADYIVANTSVLNVVRELISHPEMESHFEKMEIGPSMFTLYMGFDTPLKDLGNPNYCTCHFPQSICNLRDIGQTNHFGFEERNFVLTDYSHLDSGLAPEGKSVAVIVCDDYASHWRNFSKEDYQAEKERIENLFIHRLESILPGVSKHIIYHDAATPLTIERYTGNPDGAIYGFAQRPEKIPSVGLSRFFENLFLASAWDKFGGGFSGAIYSGYFTGIDIMRQKRIPKTTS